MPIRVPDLTASQGAVIVAIVVVLGAMGHLPAASAQPVKWHPLWTANDLGAWKLASYGGDGEVQLEDGVLTLGMGASLTGVTWADELPLPTVGYELKCSARRIQGSDFFCGVTFPYQEGHGTLILGGWGGSLVGVSCIDGRDASDNESAGYHQFKVRQWYEIRLRVRDGFIDAWIDDRRVVAIRVRGRSISVRADVNASRPLGLTTFQTVGQIKELQYCVLNGDSGRSVEELPPDRD